MRNAKVDLELPKFELDFSSSLKNTLQKLGMNQPFSSTADFSEMRKKKDIYISEVIQKTYLKVDEKGTEAAAVSEVEMVGTSADPDYEEKIETIIINRPFLFLLRNKKLPKNYEMIFMAKIETLK